jgi:sugar phosphate permease
MGSKPLLHKMQKEMEVLGKSEKKAARADNAAAAARSMYRYRTYILLVFLVSYALIFFHRMTSAVVAPDLSAAFNIGAASLGLLSSAYFYPYAFIQIPVGMMVDKYGPRKIVTFFLLLTGSAAILFGVSPSFQMALWARALVGLGAGCVYIPALKMLASWYRKQEFASLTGVMIAAGNFGALAAAAPLAWLVRQTGWRESFYIMGVFTVVVAVIDYLVIRNHPQEMGFPTVEEIDGIAVPVDSGGRRIGLLEGLRMTLTKKEFWPVTIWSIFISGAIFGFQGLWGGPFLTDVYKLSKLQAGNTLSMIPLGVILCAPVAGFLSDRVFHSRRKPLLFGSTLFMLVWVPLAFFTGSLPPQSFYPLLLAFGFFFGFFVTSFAQVKELFPLEISGTVTSAYNLFGFAGGAVYQVVMGKIIAQYPAVNGIYSAQGYQAAFQFCFWTLVLGQIFLLFSHEAKTE